MRVFFSSATPIIFVILIVGALFIVTCGLMYGLAYVIRLVEPLLFFLILGSILLFVVYVLPLSAVPKSRGRMAVLAMTLSNLCGGGVWLISFMCILLYLKWWAILLMWIFHITTPLAIIALLFDAQLTKAASLAVAFGATYGMRFYSLWLGRISSPQESTRILYNNNEEVIDAEIVE